MKKQTILYSALVLTVFIAANCASKEVKKEEPVKVAEEVKTAEADLASAKARSASSPEEMVAEMNTKLERATLQGFSAWKANVDKKTYEEWAEAAAPVVNEVIAEVPDGYVLQVTGHSDAQGNKSRNKTISAKRAKIVYDALRKKGVKSKKFTYKGVGSAQLANADDKNAGENRRVTFLVVKK